MANTQVDIAKDVGVGVNEITVTSTGNTVTNDVRVILKEGISKSEAYRTIRDIAEAVLREDIVLN